jgi:AdoMet-dependent heme synthase
MPIDELAIEVTYDCPHNCVMCSSSACHPSPLKHELTTEEIKKLLYDSANSSLTPKNFSLSGGDPLQRADVFELMQYANELGMKNLLYTTGQIIGDKKYDPETGESTIRRITKDEVRKLSQLDIKVIFDLQSPDEKICDKIMDTDGYYENILYAINLCKEYGLTVETHFVPMTVNFKHFFDYLELVKDLKIDRASYLRFVRQGRGHQNPHLELSKRQFRELQFMFLRAEGEYNPELIRLGHPIDRRWMIDSKYPIKECRGATDAPLIHPEGSVVMCPAWKELKRFSPGNIRYTSLEKLMKFGSHLPDEKASYYDIFYNFIHNDGYKEIVGKCQECPYLSKCKGGCVAQRLIHNIGKADIPLEEAVKIGADPMCFWGD